MADTGQHVMEAEEEHDQLDATSDLGSEAKSEMDTQSESGDKSDMDTKSDSGISEEFEELNPYSQSQRKMPEEIVRMMRERGMPEKVMRRMVFLGPPEEMLEMMESDGKVRRMTHKPRFVNPPPGPSGSGYMGGYRGGDVPQTQPLHPGQVRNHHGGYVFKIDDMDRFRRYLCLGTESGTYYVSTKDLGVQNIEVVNRLLAAGKGVDIVKELVKFGQGRVAKQTPLIQVLATCARQSKDLSTKRAAYKSLSDVCGIPTHLFTFIELCQKMSEESTTGKSGSGWGRAHRIGIANWYLRHKEKPMKLAMQVTKYKQRNGWTHRDALRLSHPKVDSDRGTKALAAVFKYVVKGLAVAKEAFLVEDTAEDVLKVIEYLEATEHVKTLRVAQEEEVCALIEKHSLVREHLPTEMLNSIAIWKTLLKKMPMMALIRNLGKLSSLGIIEQGTEDAALAVDKLTNTEALKYSMVHPFKIFLAMDIYGKGRGDKGSLTWPVNPEITHGLEAAFYKSFKYVEPTNKRFLIALDISASMDGNKLMNTNISANIAAAAMAMVTVRTEKHCDIMAFAGNFIPLNIQPDMTIEQVRQEMKRHHFGSTDCSLPLTYATNNGKNYDAIIIYTDNETWSGRIHVTEALKNYRSVCDNPEVKVIVVGMVSTNFSIADPNDKHMLDIVGFDADAPEIIQNFVLGNI